MIKVTKDNVLRSGTRLLNIPKNSFSLLNMYEFQDGTFKGLGRGAANRASRCLIHLVEGWSANLTRHK